MKALRPPDSEIAFYWTAWEYPSEHASGLVNREVVEWIMKKESRSASTWRLSNTDKTRFMTVAVSEHSLVIEAIERRMRKYGAVWYELPEEDLVALIRRRAADALRALQSGQERDLRSKRHFGGRYKLMPDGSLEPLDRNQG